MQVSETVLPGVVLITPTVHRDARGHFLELHHATNYQQAGIDLPMVQTNCSRSSKRVLRGLHFQRTQPQGKLISVLAGEILDVAADLDPESETFSQSVAVTLNSDSQQQFYIPPGYAHGFVVRSDFALVMYQCTALYAPGDEAGIAWNDPQLDIHWGEQAPILSTKDRELPTLQAYLAESREGL
ncbi:MAG: dTDP-4-dehydrorhamnose 3,5-epimerase [Pseudomonadales bacterium]